MFMHVNYVSILYKRNNCRLTKQIKRKKRSGYTEWTLFFIIIINVVISIVHVLVNCFSLFSILNAYLFDEERYNEYCIKSWKNRTKRVSLS